MVERRYSSSGCQPAHRNRTWYRFAHCSAVSLIFRQPAAMVRGAKAEQNKEVITGQDILVY